jgi:hypothetical protein
MPKDELIIQLIKIALGALLSAFIFCGGACQCFTGCHHICEDYDVGDTCGN